MGTQEQVTQAMAARPRRDYLPLRERRHAGRDGPLPIGHGQTNSQPRTVAAMLELLGVRPGDRVLDVGAGSGWTTALLAHLTGPSGSVIGVERVPELRKVGAANLDRSGMPWARLALAAPGVLGSPTDGPFDRILVSAEARTLPRALVDQLVPGGVMVIPVLGWMHRVTRDLDSADEGERGSHALRGPAYPAGRLDDARVEIHGAYRFVPLIE